LYCPFKDGGVGCLKKDNAALTSCLRDDDNKAILATEEGQCDAVDGKALSGAAVIAPTLATVVVAAVVAVAAVLQTAM
jgi:hypothetical protein